MLGKGPGACLPGAEREQALAVEAGSNGPVGIVLGLARLPGPAGFLTENGPELVTGQGLASHLQHPNAPGRLRVPPLLCPQLRDAAGACWTLGCMWCQAGLRAEVARAELS